jgi:hypothetical protein
MPEGALLVCIIRALHAQAENIVADAHVIARKRGSNILEIVKQQIKDIKK